jgi:predicted nucleotide-binding protein (sugar kinase/HSP70/actin superfamily)
MNYVCSAGTGSFIEEQAKKLNIELDSIGDIVMGTSPPTTSDRCTVFMEQEVDRLVSLGYTTEECIGAVLYSVAKNYLTKVVGRRAISSKKIYFQGATAKNRGLVAAFESILNRQIIVSSYCHQMGSYGIALLTRRRMKQNLVPQKSGTTFKGLDVFSSKITTRHEECKLCSNKCKITYVDIEGRRDSPSWGYMCGRDPSDTKPKLNGNFLPFKRRIGLDPRPNSVGTYTIGIPNCLSFRGYVSLWNGFFRSIGLKVKFSPATDANIIQQGTRLATADFCLPVKVGLGLVEALVKDPEVDYIFIPYMIKGEGKQTTTNNYFCPVAQAFPGIVLSSMRTRNIDVSKIISPVIDLQSTPSTIHENLYSALCPKIEVRYDNVVEAWNTGMREQKAFNQKRLIVATKLFHEIETENKKAIVIIGRPYNVLDWQVNLNLPRKISELGIMVIPIDLIPYHKEDIPSYHGNMYWEYGIHILAASKFIRQHKNLFPIYITNYSCGPDSFLLSYFEEIMKGTPYLIIELDEHGSDGGYLTRIESFLDLINSQSWSTDPVIKQEQNKLQEQGESRERSMLALSPSMSNLVPSWSKVWIPHVHAYGANIFTGALRFGGLTCQELPLEDIEALELGRSNTRGSECLPCILTTGAILKQLNYESKITDSPASSFVMGCTTGPCRFGQYALLQKMILNRNGYTNMPVFAAGDRNLYVDMSLKAKLRLWKAVVTIGILTKCCCRCRPYEIVRGSINSVMKEIYARMQYVFETGKNIEEALDDCIHKLHSVPIDVSRQKPVIGIVGEIYVRLNRFANDGLIDVIESSGCEAWLVPMAEWILYVCEWNNHLVRQSCTFSLLAVISCILTDLGSRTLHRIEQRLCKIASLILHDREEPSIQSVLELGMNYVPFEFGGETILAVGRAEKFILDGAKAVVNASPFGCMPGAISAAILREIQSKFGTPVINMVYDGEVGSNNRLKSFLENIKL